MPIQWIQSWYQKNERLLGAISLLGGFLFNAFTLTRVDEMFENAWIVAHLLVVAVCTVLVSRHRTTDDTSAYPVMHFWATTVLQFFYGGLISTFIVFYFRSASLSVTWPFFVFLIIAFFANESFKTKYSELPFQISYFFLSVYLFLIFFIPVLIHQSGAIVFVLSGCVALTMVLLFLALLRVLARQQYLIYRTKMFISIAVILVVVNGLYFLNLIPPLPISLQDGGIYHSIIRRDDGNYAVLAEQEGKLDFAWKYVDKYPTYHVTAGEPAYAYSAIFSPVSFNTKVIHEWQRYDTVSKKWITEETIRLSVVGGRLNGYRTYSLITGLVTGKWRVNVKMQSGQRECTRTSAPCGQVIGRMLFDVILQNERTPLHTVIK